MSNAGERILGSVASARRFARGKAMKAKATYDPQADAIGIYFRRHDAEYQESKEVAPGLTLDYDTQGRVIGVEILGVRRFLAEGEIVAEDEAEAAETPAAE